MECCENSEDVVKSYLITPQNERFWLVWHFTTFRGRSEKILYKLFHKSPYVWSFEDRSLWFLRSWSDPAAGFFTMLWNVVKFLGMLWNRFSQHFTTFRNISQHPHNFHNISQHLRKTRQRQLSNASGLAQNVPVVAEDRPEPSASQKSPQHLQIPPQEPLYTFRHDL